MMRFTSCTDLTSRPSHRKALQQMLIELILNSLVGALNNRSKLPDMMVFMLSNTKFWCDESALNFTMDTLIKSMIKEIQRIIQTHQRDLPVKAVGPDPKKNFVKLNWKPDKAVDSVPMYPKKRRTFNKILDTIVRPRNVSTILLHEINDKLDPDLFLTHGDLSQKGYQQVWASLSEAIQDFMTIGYQKKKIYSVKPRQMDIRQKEPFSLCSSDDDSITNFGQADLRTRRQTAGQASKWNNPEYKRDNNNRKYFY